MPAIFEPESDEAIHSKDYTAWADITLTRGSIYAVPLMLVTGCFLGGVALWFLPACILMGLCYSSVFWMKREYWIINEWTFGEITYGFLLVIPVIIAST